MVDVSLPNYPSKEVKKFGERVANALITADVRRGLGGLGGCKEFDYRDFAPDLHPYIKEYFKGNADSVAVIYAAMRTKELTS